MQQRHTYINAKLEVTYERNVSSWDGRIILRGMSVGERVTFARVTNCSTLEEAKDKLANELDDKFKEILKSEAFM
jgi:hypothetical protein